MPWTPLPDITPFGNTLTVAISGGDFTSIAAAIAASVAGDVILIYPGTYNEVGPLTVPTDVSLQGLGVLRTTINFTNTNSVGFEMLDNNQISNMTINAPTGAGGIGIHWAPGVAPTGGVLDGVVIGGGEIGVHDESGGFGVLIQSSASIGATETAFETSNGSKTDYRSTGALGLVALDNCFHCWGAGSEMVLQSCKVDGANNVTDGIFIENDGLVTTTGLVVSETTHGVHIGAGGGTIHLYACDLRDNVTWDILTDNGAGDNVYLAACRASTNKISLAVGTLVQGTIVSDVEDDEGTISLGQFSIGLPLAGRETSMGEGDSFTTNMHVFTNTNLEVGAWVDETVTARSPSASTFAPFPGVGVGNTCYFGWEDDTFPNMKQKINGTAINLGTGALVWEFWNGGAWTAFTLMVTDSVAPYDQYAEGVWERASQSDHFRHGDMPGWASKVLNGQAAYWIRSRVSVAITTSPLIQQVKIGRSRTEFNADGFEEHFGASEPPFDYPFGLSHMTEVSGLVPANADLAYSATVVLRATRNKMANNSLDGTGGAFAIYEGTDTSKPLIVTAEIYPEGVGGDFEIGFTHTVHRPDDPLDGTVAESAVFDVQTAVTANVPQEFSFSVDISQLLVGDTVAFAFSRDARGANDPPDTLVAAVVLESVRVTVTSWQ